MNIVYVILHYMAGKDTIECAESIFESSKNSEHNVLVVVVDNASPNDSYELLKAQYSNNKRVKLIHSDVNLGFARGNNLGFEYAKKNLNPDFIAMLNNDTVISQTDFNEVLVRKYKEKKYAVLGPDIITADGYHQNPGEKQSWSLKELRTYRLKKRIRFMLSLIGLDSSLGEAVARNKNVYRTQTLQGDRENTILHGACLIFSRDYIEKFDGINGDTFLYMEEDILKLYADYYGFLMLYSSELSILHKEDVATNMEGGSSGRRTRRKYKYLIESSKVYSNLKKEFEKTAKKDEN